jgi:hypothetical protein
LHGVVELLLRLEALLTAMGFYLAFMLGEFIREDPEAVVIRLTNRAARIRYFMVSPSWCS